MTAYSPLIRVAVLIFYSLHAHAQHTVTIQVNAVAKQHLRDTIFVTGNHNKWQPADEHCQLIKQNDGTWAIQLRHVKKGLLEYKFTRGSWKKLESTSEGRLEAPRRAAINADTTLYAEIPAWRDDFPGSTASPQVGILDTAFPIPQLNRERRIWIYLPKDYSSSGKSYPVLYMHDGQDLFDEATSAGRIGPLEWGVDETIDKAEAPRIVVAIDHHDDKQMRIQEYYMHPNYDYPVVDGEAYLEFIVHHLKPYIDKHYRTKSDRAHTAMAGSSMGGLITFYAGLRYPEIFGSLGVFSPSVWLDDGHILTDIRQLKTTEQVQHQRYFFYAGGNENRIKPDGDTVRMHDDVIKASDLLKEKANPEMEILINPEGQHGAWYWSQAFPRFYEWLSQP